MTDNLPASPDANVNRQTLPPARVGVSLEQIENAYAKAESPATSEQLELIFWLYRHAKACRLSGNEAIGKLFTPPRDGSTISKLFSAKYGAGLDTICADIRKLRLLDAQESSANEPIVRLPRLYETVSAFAELVHATRSMGFLFGSNQSGKSTTLAQYVAASPRRTIRVNMPDGGACGRFMDRCIRAVGLGEREINGDKSGAILRRLTPDTELIVDEYHQCWVKGTLAAQTVEKIRLWREESGCSVLLVCTNLDGLTDRRSKGVMSQTANRGVFREQIPVAPHADDLAAVFAGYRLSVPLRGSDAARIVDAICRESGLGRLCKFLLAGRLLASARQEVYAWGHFVSTVQKWDGKLFADLFGGKEGR